MKRTEKELGPVSWFYTKAFQVIEGRLFPV